MEMKHTPGPWTADPEGEEAVIVEGADGSIVCEVHGPANDPRAEANASLITAAPDLLAALVELVERAEAEGNLDGLPEYDPARAAIAKAKGAA